MHYIKMSLIFKFKKLKWNSAVDNSFVFDFKNANFVGLNSFPNSFEWNDNFNVDEMYSKILEILHLGIHLFKPKKPTISSKQPAWYNRRLSNWKNKKNKAYKRFCGDQTNLSLKVTYLLCQKEFDALNAFLHRSYILSTEKHLKDNSKFFWTFINSKRNSNGLPSYMYYLDNGSTDSKIICDLFAKLL